METYLILIFIPLILLAFLAFGLFTFVNEWKVRSKGIKTMAKVIHVEKIRWQQEHSYKLTVEFTNHLGKTVVQEIDDTLTNPPKEEIPFTIPIIYLELEDKIDIVFAKNKTMMIIGISLTLFSVLMLILFAFYALEFL